MEDTNAVIYMDSVSGLRQSQLEFITIIISYDNLGKSLSFSFHICQLKIVFSMVTLRMEKII